MMSFEYDNHLLLPKSAVVLWQHILAIDVRYNAFRNCNFRSLYIRRRNQLIREIGKSESNSFRKHYLKLRCQFLALKYGISYDQLSIRSKSSSHKSGNRLDDSFDLNVSPKDLNITQSQLLLNLETVERLMSPLLSHMKQCDSDKSSISENYAFAGMHHIFDQHTDAVTCVKFANNDKSLLGCCSKDGTLSICQLTPSPATVLYILRGHSDAVCYFEWSLSNDLIVSCSRDATVKLWDPASGACLRTIRDPFDSAVLACTFQPNNNNMIVTGNEKGYVQILNVSTGIYTNAIDNDGGKILCLSFDSSGKILWSGDSKGCISSFIFEVKRGRLLRANKVLLIAGCSITSVSSRLWVKQDIRETLLLVNSACNMLLLFKIYGRDGRLETKHCFPIKHQNSDLVIRSSFCPILSFKDGICVVSASEDTCVYFFNADESQSKSKFVNKLQGHSFPVLDVSFNYDESLLASSDTKGNVIVWKREAVLH